MHSTIGATEYTGEEILPDIPPEQELTRACAAMLRLSAGALRQEIVNFERPVVFEILGDVEASD